MHSRRKFLTQGSLATAALLTLKPFTGLSELVSPLTGTNGNYGKLCFLHTAGNKITGDENAVNFVKKVKSANPNVLLLNSDIEEKNRLHQLAFDASAQTSEDLAGDYKIVHKGDYKTGIFWVAPGDQDVIQKANRLAGFLKKEKNCTVVVCLSQLGYQNKNKPDDLSIAKASSHLDIIVSGHYKNFNACPYIALNSNKAEVIIHSAMDSLAGCGLIEIGFDKQRRKQSISFSA